MLVLPGAGELVQIGGFGTQYKIVSADTRGAAAIVEHTLEPGLLGAPMHRHSREDEVSCVLEGTLSLQIGEELHTAEVGSVVLKPRGVFHAFWNAGSEPVRFLEVITPGGFESYFRELQALLPDDSRPDLGVVVALAARYGLEFDFASIPQIIQRHGVRLG